jgi:hypothetical protein
MAAGIEALFVALLARNLGVAVALVWRGSVRGEREPVLHELGLHGD